MKYDASITGRDGDEYEIRLLTRSLARSSGEHLVRIHNIIPYVHWELSDLMADSSPKGVAYTQKWQLSFAVFDGREPIGLLVAYKRDVSDTHPVEAIYIHRLAVAPSYQGKGVGARLLRTALDHYAQEFPHIQTYTVQTNDEAANEKVIGFYEDAGFERFVPVQYPDKLDILLKLEQAELPVPALR